MKCQLDDESRCTLREAVLKLTERVGEPPDPSTGTEGKGMAKQVSWLVTREQEKAAARERWVKRLQVIGVFLGAVVAAITILAKLGCSANPIKRVEVEFKRDGGANEIRMDSGP